MASLSITVLCLLCVAQSLLGQPIADYSPTAGPANDQNEWEEDQFQDDGEAEVDGWNDDETDDIDWVLQDDIPEGDITIGKRIADENIAHDVHQLKYGSDRKEEHPRLSRSVYSVNAPRRHSRLGSGEVNNIVPDEAPVSYKRPAQQSGKSYIANFPLTGFTVLHCKARDSVGNKYRFQLQPENSITSDSTGNRVLKFGSFPRNVVRIECVDELSSQIVFDSRSCSIRRHRRGGNRSYCLMPSFIQEARPHPTPAGNNNNGNRNGRNNGAQNGGNNGVQNGGNNGVQNGGNNGNNNEVRRRRRQTVVRPSTHSSIHRTSFREQFHN